jgi:hypothetical protein
MQSSVRSFVHSVPPSPHQHATERTLPASETNRRDLGYARRPTLYEIKSELHDALLSAIPRHKVPAKEVAFEIEASQATVESMRQNGVPDAMGRLILACLAYPEFQARVARLMGLQAMLHPDAQRLMSELVTLMQRRT